MKNRVSDPRALLAEIQGKKQESSASSFSGKSAGNEHDHPLQFDEVKLSQ